MSNSNTRPANIRSGQGPGTEKRGDVTSEYNSGDEEERIGVAGARERRKKEEAVREKLKEELLRQFEAGQLKVAVAEGNFSSQNSNVVVPSHSQPRHIPTLEEQRDQMVSSTRRIVPTNARPSLTLPDVSRPPPGFSHPPVQAVPIPYYQPQSVYSYEDTIVTRVLQSLVGNRAQQVEPPDGQPQGVIEKVMNWDVNLDKRLGSDRKREEMRSRDRRTRSRSRDKMRGRSAHRIRGRSLSIASIRVIRPADNTKSRRKSVIKRSASRSRSRCREISYLSERDKSEERWKYGGTRHIRVLSPLTKKCSQRTPGRTSQRKRNYEGSRRSSSRKSNSSPSCRPRVRYSPKYNNSRGNSPRTRGCSPRTRKIVLLSPVRVKKSVREIINEEKDFKRFREFREESESPVKKRVKDRLGVRKVDREEIEMYNMDVRAGRCGAVAVVKEYIDSKNGIMELRTSEGGRSAVILFSAGQVWVPDRKRDPNGPPKRYVTSSSLSLHTQFPVGQEVLINARRVECEMIDMQATAVWPKYTEVPEYELKINKLDENLHKIKEICMVENLVPVCINGLAPVGSMNIWSAKILEIVDENWGVVEIISVPRDGNREFSYRFLSFFHKHDVWVEEGVRVGDNRFYKNKPMNELVVVQQPVDVVTRSIIREKGLAMKKAVGTNVEMQAICVSLKPGCIPEGAPKGTRVEGGPGAFGGTSRGETPYMFKKGLKHQLNVKLAHYLQASGKVYKNIDPSFVVKLESSKFSDSVKRDENISQKGSEKRVHKLTEDPTKTNDVNVTVDSQNNVLEAIHIRPAAKLFDRLSNSTARVREYLSESIGLLENLTKDWLCLFQTSDCVLTQGTTAVKLYPVGTKVQINANLVDCSQRIQYVASCVWIKSENALILPNNVDINMIPTEKKIVYDDLNFKLSHLDMKSGVVYKILDDNFGLLKQNLNLVLFDTCDFWTSEKGTAAQSSKSLRSLVSVGDTVMFHAAWIQPQNLTGIPYLATAVWLVNPSPFPAGKCPAAIRRDKIHPDKVKIYEMVTRCSASQEGLSPSPEEKEDLGACKTKVYDQKGVVKVAFKLMGSNVLMAAILEFNKGNYAFYLSNISVESQEKTKICIPETKVYFSAIPTGSGEDYPVSHIATSVSHIHQKMPLNKDVDKIFLAAKDSLKMIMEKKPHLSNLLVDMPQIIKLDASINNVPVSDCFPTGRLVCMFDEKCGILEDHQRELAYFETTDLNLSSDLKLKDIAKIMTRCRDVTIRFQSSHVLDGPVKMIVHDGTASISSNIERYFPDVQIKKSNIILKPKSFCEEKVLRAVAAVEQYKVNKVLTPDHIIDSGQFKSTLGKGRRYSSTSSLSDSTKLKKFIVDTNSVEVACIVKHTGKVMAILNDSFGLLQFSKDSSKLSYCLFDTFDLYLEGGKSAAQSNKSVADILDLDMTVYFHACEILPECPVSWLATGVWRHEKVNQPKPVAFRKITNEKIHVFKKVAETCKVLVVEEESLADSAKESKSVCSTLGIESSDDIKEENKAKDIVESGDFIDSKRDIKPKTSYLGSEQPLNVKGNLVKADVENEETVLSEVSSDKTVTCIVQHKISNNIREEGKAEDVVKSGDSNDNNRAANQKTSNLGSEEQLNNNREKIGKADVENKGTVHSEVSVDGTVKMKMEPNEPDGNVSKLLHVTSETKNQDNIEMTGEIKESTSSILNKEDVLPDTSGTPVMALPECLSAQSTSGTLETQLDDKMAILTLDKPAGRKALLHRSKLWLSNREMKEIRGWEDVSEKKIKIDARRVEGFEEFDYQATYAYLAPEMEVAESSVSQEEDDMLKKDS